MTAEEILTNVLKVIEGIEECTIDNDSMCDDCYYVSRDLRKAIGVPK